MVQLYYKTNSYSAASRMFDGRRRPDPTVVRDTVLRFESTGSVLDIVRTGRPSEHNEAAFDEAVAKSVKSDPQMSQRQRADALGVSRRKLQDILQRLNIHPYRPSLLLDLTDAQKARRTAFCGQFLQRTSQIPWFLDNLWFSDECRFSLDRTVNKHNCVFYASTNPHYSLTISHSRRSVHVWAALSSSGIIGPIYLDETVNAENYIKMLESQVLPELFRRQPHGLFSLQQDGASPHTAAVTQAWLKMSLPGSWIGAGGPMDWPAKSPDLSPLDFFLWGFLKSSVYEDSPQTPEALKAAIQNEIGQISIETCKKVCQSVVRRCKECLQSNGEQVRAF